MAGTKPANARLGHYVVTAVGGEQVRSFVPPPLPPNPPLQIEGLYGLLEEANRALGRLDGVTSILPDTPLFLYMYVRKEALLSSQIEGTQSSLSDLLLFESDEVPGVLRVPAQGGHDSVSMADTLPAAWRTVFRPEGGHWVGDSGTVSAMISERCPP